MPTLLLDHCVWRPTAQALRKAGFRCISLKDLGRSEAKNGEVIALATKRRCLLLTRDADFTDVRRYPIGRHAGIIYLRITPAAIEDVHRTLLIALRQINPAHLHGSLLIVEAGAYRLRRALP